MHGWKCVWLKDLRISRLFLSFFTRQGVSCEKIDTILKQFPDFTSYPCGSCGSDTMWWPTWISPPFHVLGWFSTSSSRFISKLKNPRKFVSCMLVSLQIQLSKTYIAILMSEISHQKMCAFKIYPKQLATLWRNMVPTDPHFSTNPSLQNPSPNVHRPENGG